MQYFEGQVSETGKVFFLKGAFCNLLITNDDVVDILIFDEDKIIARVKGGESLEFRGYKAERLTIKSSLGNANIRFWAW
ncbi:MAG: hypothetical protein QXW01_03730 [Candidatus Aenigmatarchaeota archaeon]